MYSFVFIFYTKVKNLIYSWEYIKSQKVFIGSDWLPKLYLCICWSNIDTDLVSFFLCYDLTKETCARSSYFRSESHYLLQVPFPFCWEVNPLTKTNQKPSLFLYIYIQAAPHSRITIYKTCNRSKPVSTRVKYIQTL
jgi:hypothetical protein